MISLVPFAVPMVRNSCSLKSSGVASFDDEFCLSFAVVSRTAHVSEGPLDGETSPMSESWLARHGSSRTYMESRAHCNPAMGVLDCSACSDFHFSPDFIPFGGSVHARAKRSTHCCQACCCSGKRESTPFILSTEPSGEIVNSMLFPSGSTRWLSPLGFLSRGPLIQTPVSRIRNLPRA